MKKPEGPYIRTTYFKDGTMKQEPIGFGGKLCHTATEPYAKRQGRVTKTATSEADDPNFLERERETSQRAKA